MQIVQVVPITFFTVKSSSYKWFQLPQILCSLSDITESTPGSHCVLNASFLSSLNLELYPALPSSSFPYIEDCWLIIFVECPQMRLVGFSHEKIQRFHFWGKMLCPHHISSSSDTYCQFVPSGVTQLWSHDSDKIFQVSLAELLGCPLYKNKDLWTVWGNTTILILIQLSLHWF